MDLRAWLSFFRIRNLITVPGDPLVGAAAAGLFARRFDPRLLLVIVPVVLASCFLYLFGLADNDIVGAKTDVNRPLATGKITLRAASNARLLCLLAAFALTLLVVADPLLSAAILVVTTVAILFYNRNKFPLLMGLCRGLDVMLGAAAFAGCSPNPLTALKAALVPALVWTLYIAAVTKYSEREVTDPTNDRKVQWLVRALIVLQLVFLICYALI